MSIKVGLDTSFVLGLIDDQDLWHPQAQVLQAVLDANEFHTYIFDCVLAEVISALARRTHEKRRTAAFSELTTRIRTRFPTKAITWLYPDLPANYDAVLSIVEQSTGELNFNDALIVISCRKRGIPFVASFDSDFDHVQGLTRVVKPEDLSTPP
jgi:predicted nucleic acid-binding protein